MKQGESSKNTLIILLSWTQRWLWCQITWMKQGGSSQEGLWGLEAVNSCILPSQSQTCKAQNCAQFCWLLIDIVHLPLTFLDHFVCIQHPLWGLTLVLLQRSWYILDILMTKNQSLAIKWSGCASKGAPTSRGSSKVGLAPSFSNCFVIILVRRKIYIMKMMMTILPSS